MHLSGWAACEDLQRPDGAMVLMSADGDAEWFEKGLCTLSRAYASDNHFFLFGIVSHYTSHVYYL